MLTMGSDASRRRHLCGSESPHHGQYQVLTKVTIETSSVYVLRGGSFLSTMVSSCLQRIDAGSPKGEPGSNRCDRTWILWQSL